MRLPTAPFLGTSVRLHQLHHPDGTDMASGEDRGCECGVDALHGRTAHRRPLRVHRVLGRSSHEALASPRMEAAASDTPFSGDWRLGARGSVHQRGRYLVFLRRSGTNHPVVPHPFEGKSLAPFRVWGFFLFQGILSYLRNNTL